MTGPESRAGLRSLVLDPIQGRQRLWVVFWLYWLLAPILIEHGIALLRLAPETQIRATLAATGLYAVYTCLSLWRCAFNTDFRWLGYGARAVAALNLLLAPVALYLAATGNFGAGA